MLNSNIFQNVELPYEPLPEAAYAAARMSMVKCGFPEKAILDEYSFSSPSKGTTIKINSLVFAHAIHRNPAEYASFTIYNAVNGHSDEALVSVLAASAAPFHIIHRDNAFSLWASSVKNNQPVPFHIQSAITYDQLDEVLSNYAADLKPQRIIDVKQGRDTFTLPIFRDNIQPLQLSFWATDVTRKLLVDHFAQAVEVLRVHARKWRADIGAYDQELTSLAIQLLGAVILADTGVLGDQVRLHDVSLRQVIGAAYSRFERYFQPELIDRYWEVAEEAYQILRQIRYAGFVPEMLSEIYTAAYSKEQRKKLGRFDTPLYLTRRTGVFEATARTVVIFAQKKIETRSHSNNPVRIRSIQSKTLEDFKKIGVFTASSMLNNQVVWGETARKSKGSQNTYIMDYRVVLPDYAWQTIISHCIHLENYASVLRGAIVGQKSQNKRWANYLFPKEVPWLTRVKDVIPHPFLINYEKATTIIYPNEISEDHFYYYVDELRLFCP